MTENIVSAIESVSNSTPQLSTTGGTSDARFIKNYCPVVEFGLVGLTMHQANENVACADIETLSKIYKKTLENYFTSKNMPSRP